MNNEYEVLYSYLDALLRLQSSAADMFEHTGVLGTVRENFLVQQIIERIDNPLIHTGQVIANARNTGQMDIIIRKNNTINPNIGGQARIIANDCAAVIEVKSNAIGTDFRDFNNKSEQIKLENPDVICGFFCYKLNCKKETILKRFGYKYDREYLNFEIDNDSLKEYPNIDFVVCIDDKKEFVGKTDVFYNKFFFLGKNLIENSKYDLVLVPPFSFYFLSEIRKQSTN